MERAEKKRNRLAVEDSSICTTEYNFSKAVSTLLRPMVAICQIDMVDTPSFHAHFPSCSPTRFFGAFFGLSLWPRFPYLPNLKISTYLLTNSFFFPHTLVYLSQRYIGIFPNGPGCISPSGTHGPRGSKIFNGKGGGVQNRALIEY